jgi:Aspartyl protease
MPSLSFSYIPSVGPLIQVAIWPPNYRPSAPTPAIPIAPTLYNALIDTGASCTCISPKVVADLSLPPTGKQHVGHAQGSTATNSYQFQVAFFFPQMQTVTAAGVLQAQVAAFAVMRIEFIAPAGSAFDVLLGRDIICRGAFAMSFDGHAIISF